MLFTNKYDFSGKTALITGGSSGIGLALAKQLALSGANVCILARRKEMLEKACRKIEKKRMVPSQQIHYISADVSDSEELSTKLSNYISENHAPEIIINSAGVAHPGQIENLNLELFHWQMNVNYFGTVNTIKLVVPEMIKVRKGLIINISSIAGFLGVYGYTAYSGSKFAVRGFTDALRSELKPHNIQVSIAFPPDTQTPQLEYENQFKPEITRELAGSAGLMSPDTVAKQILKQASKGKYIITPGLESAAMFRLNNLLGRRIYPLLDYLIRNAKRKIDRQNTTKK